MLITVHKMFVQRLFKTLLVQFGSDVVKDLPPLAPF